jgi:hypothetical protein
MAATRKSWLHFLLDWVDSLIRLPANANQNQRHKCSGACRLAMTFIAVQVFASGISLAQQIMPAEKAAALRQSFPKTDSEQWNKLFADPKTVLYTDQAIIPAYQHASVGLLVVNGSN